MSERSVLIVDDDQALVTMLRDGLENLGYRVACAYDSLQGVLMAHQIRPDIIILDFHMPAGGGATVYERLRGSTDTARTPIVFTTAASVQEVKGSIRSTPNTYFQQKPVTLERMQSVLEKILDTLPVRRSPGAQARPETAPPRPATLSAPPAPVSPPPSMTPTRTPIPSTPPRPVSPPYSTPPRPVTPQPSITPRATPPPSMAPRVVDLPVPGGMGGGAPSGGRHHEFEVRVLYADTDKLGIIYYANYFKYFEAGRTELLRSLGVRYKNLESDRGLYLPAVEARCEYLSPCRYDELLRVRSWLSWVGLASLCFRHEIFNNDQGGRLVARGFSRHALVNDSWKPVRVPRDLRSVLERCVIRD